MAKVFTQVFKRLGYSWEIVMAAVKKNIFFWVMGFTPFLKIKASC